MTADTFEPQKNQIETINLCVDGRQDPHYEQKEWKVDEGCAWMSMTADAFDPQKIQIETNMTADQVDTLDFGDDGESMLRKKMTWCYEITTRRRRVNGRFLSIGKSPIDIRTAAWNKG